MDKLNEVNEKIIKRQDESIELLKSLLKTKDLIIYELKEQLRIGDVIASDEFKEAINYSQCCETLDCSYAKGYNDAITKMKEEAKYIKHN